MGPDNDRSPVLPTSYVFHSTSEDPEIRAIEFIQKILDGLNKSSTRRVLNFVSNREAERP